MPINADTVIRIIIHGITLHFFTFLNLRGCGVANRMRTARRHMILIIETQQRADATVGQALAASSTREIKLLSRVDSSAELEYVEHRGARQHALAISPAWRNVTAQFPGPAADRYDDKTERFEDAPLRSSSKRAPRPRVKRRASYPVWPSRAGEARC